MFLAATKRWWRSAIFVGLLVLLGVAVYYLQPPEPRWTFESRAGAPSLYQYANLLGFAPDGGRLFTAPPSEVRKLDLTRSPYAITGDPVLQVWNSATGEALASYPSNGRLIGEHMLSRDCRYCAGECWRNPNKIEHFVCLADLESGTEHSIPMPTTDVGVRLAFSPCGQYLAILVPPFDKGELHIYETDSGNLIEKRASRGIAATHWVTTDYVIHRVPGKRENDSIELWSWRERKAVAVFERAVTGAQVTPDGRYLLTRNMNPDKERDGVHLVWNLADRKLQAQLRSGPDWTMPALSPDGRFAVLRDGEERIALWDLSSGKKLGSVECKARQWSMVFAPDSRFLTVLDTSLGNNRSLEGTDAVCMIQLEGFKRLWDKSAYEVLHPQFSADSSTLFHVNTGNTDVVAIDVATGTARSVIKLASSSWAGQNLTLSSDGRSLLATRGDSRGIARIWRLAKWGDHDEGAWRRTLRWLKLDPDRFEPRFDDVAVVFDVETSRERLRLRGWNVSMMKLSDDGQTLATVHYDQGAVHLRLWDVDHTRPLRYALGIPLVVGAIGLVLVKGYRRWKKPRARAEVQPPASGG